MDTVVSAVSDCLHTCGFGAPGLPILVGVSGGIDSMTLLDVLDRLRLRQSLKLGVAHLDHGLRGSHSRADARLVRSNSQLRGLPYFEERAEVKRHARTHGWSLEMAGRDLRHTFFARTAQRFGAKLIALGHQADDQVELCFLRLLRGTGGDGLAGMRSCSGLPGSAAFTILRPLLTVTREEICRYAREHQVPFREDASNLESTFLRNRVRHELLPLLHARFQAKLGPAILRAMEVIGAEADLAQQLADGWLASQEPGSFDGLHTAVQRRVIHQQLLRAGIGPEFQLIEKLRLHSSCPVKTPVALICRGADGRLRRVEPAPKWSTTQTTASLRRSGRLAFADLEIRWSTSRKRPRLDIPQTGVEYFDADQVGGTVNLRYWRPGDRFQPSGMARAVKIQDLFVNLKVPKAERHCKPLATNALGEIFWVDGIRISDRHKLTATSRRFLKWEWHRA